jgi:hypothetical protein
MLTAASYTTQLTTCYETTEVYTTTTCIESFYTTVTAGSTVVICTHFFGLLNLSSLIPYSDVTETSTIELTSAYTITETLEPPTTKATVLVSSFPLQLWFDSFAFEVTRASRPQTIQVYYSVLRLLC